MKWLRIRNLLGLVLWLTLAVPSLAAARTAAEYLPPDADLDPAIPTPESVLGWEVGDWHVSHDKLVQYMKVLSESSPRVIMKVTGYSHEQRPLMLLAVTAEGNLPRLEDLRQSHLDGDPEAPLVTWLGYSVHGDEPSGSNAALLVAYYLAASRSGIVDEWLQGSVILIDPSLNPDGLNRFASWVNSNAGAVAVADPAARQHNQTWPEGRTNHYWFDLNRDWLPLVHPESRARLAEFRRWQPHVLTDHHEQDGYPGFFFQPGVPTRQNPLTPPENLELTRALAAFHADVMDAAGQPIFTEEAYDDFYFGKGSTYPDINGSIGILFEQRAIGGQALEISNGVETFRTAIANQLRVSLSTLRGAWELRDRLRAYRQQFFAGMDEASRRAGHAGWIVGDDGDPARAQAFLDLLDRHGIEHYAVAEAVRAGNHAFDAGNAWFLPTRQRQFGLLQAMMEQRTSFEDETFYDVSAWTIPLAYNLPFATLRQSPRTEDPLVSSTGLAPDEDAPAWLIPWNQLQAAEVLQRLLDAGARVRTALEQFSVHCQGGLKAFEPGTLLIQAGIQEQEKLGQIQSVLSEAALSGLVVNSAQHTITTVGPDFGGDAFPLVPPVRPLLLGGDGMSAYNVGEAWFTLDQRIGLATPIVRFERLTEVPLLPYTHLVLPDGDYKNIDVAHLDSIRDWVVAGGVAIAFGRAAVWLEGLCFEADPALCQEQAATEADPQQEAVEPRPYGSFENDVARLTIGGAIVQTILDTSHPLAFGFPRSQLALMRQGTAKLSPAANAYATPVRYAAEPLLAGYIGEERLDEFAGGPAVIAEKRGEGLVVRFANNPLFRGFWRGSERLFLNVLYFGPVIEATELPE